MTLADFYQTMYGMPSTSSSVDTSLVADLPATIKPEDIDISEGAADYPVPLPPPARPLTAARRLQYRAMAGDDPRLQIIYQNYIHPPGQPIEIEPIRIEGVDYVKMPKIWPPKHLAYLKDPKKILQAYLEGSNYLCFCSDYVFQYH